MSSTPKDDPHMKTRMSLIAKLRDWGDTAKWQEFFETYWRLLYSAAARSGLRNDEAEEVVQETCIAVANNIEKYDPLQGSFKGWMLNMVRWRIVDQIRRRPRNRHTPHDDDSRATSPIDRIASEDSIERLWNEEWQTHLLTTAMARLKRQVSAKHFQIFECIVVKEWSAPKTAKTLEVNLAQVYLVKHRLRKMLKREMELLG